MDKSLFVFILIGLGALYLVTHFIGDIQAEDDQYRNNTYNVEHKYDQYQKTDSVGQPILVVSGADATTQESAWHASKVKKEFLELFPDYTEMKTFIKERVRGEEIVKKLLQTVKSVESKFYAGEINSEQAKEKLDSLK